MKAMFTTVDRDVKNNIVFIEDLSNLTGSMSITNDAEKVIDHMRAMHGNQIRIVYKDTDNEWWEMYILETRMNTTVGFKPWHGLAWDILKR